MILANFLFKRKSIRDFKNKLGDEEVLDGIRASLDELEQVSEGHIKLKLYEYGDNIYEGLKGKGGYSGVMIKAPHYIGLDLMDMEDQTIVDSSYYMQKLITRLNELGFGTCWVTLGYMEDEDKKEVLGEDIRNVKYLLAFGYPKLRNPFYNETFSERLAIKDIVFEKELGNNVDLNQLEARGLDDLFYYIRFAPSAYNKQPWRFLIKDNIVELLIAYEDEEQPSLIDAGIIMYYFEAMANTMGIKNKWKLTHGVQKIDNINYRSIGEYKL